MKKDRIIIEMLLLKYYNTNCKKNTKLSISKCRIIKPENLLSNLESHKI